MSVPYCNKAHKFCNFIAVWDFYHYLFIHLVQSLAGLWWAPVPRRSCCEPPSSLVASRSAECRAAALQFRVARLLDEKDGGGVGGVANVMGITSGIARAPDLDESSQALRGKATGAGSHHLPLQPSDETWYHANPQQSNAYIPSQDMAFSDSVTNPLTLDNAGLAGDRQSSAQDFVQAVSHFFQIVNACCGGHPDNRT
jgi:hypothetical protein